MSQNSNNVSTDLRGVTNLTVDAIVGITNIVESLHNTINRPSWLLGQPKQDKTNGITAMVYNNIRTVAKLTGDKIDDQLTVLSSLLEKSDTSYKREAAISILNGVLGHHLASQNNPLAISMQFRKDGEPLDEESLFKMIWESDGKVVIMVHGACLNDIQWNKQGHDHGMELFNDLKITPLYLHYNTGLHISENGKKLSELLEKIISQIPKPIEISIIAHSMGGLVCRSACYYAKESNCTWLLYLKKIIFIGTPHHGALLEKGGNLIDILLDINPYSAPFSRLGKIRSSGVTDLRYGNLLDEDWNKNDRFKFSGDCRTPVPLPENVNCYFIATTTRPESDKIGDQVIGDGLVTVSSALGRHKNIKLNLVFPEQHQWIGRGINHMELLSNQEVYQTIKNWMLV